MKRRDATVISAGAAHVLAWVVGLWLVVVPAYGIADGSTRYTATLMEVNGPGVVLPLLLTPVVLTGLGLLAALRAGTGLTRRNVLLGVSAALLLGFCAVSIFSVGLFYFPAAAALIVSAVTGSRRAPENPANGGVRHTSAKSHP